MINQFLNNVNEGKNNLWRYLITLFISLPIGLSTLIAMAVSSIVIIFLGSFFYPPLNFFLETASQFYVSIILLYLLVKFLHKRNFMSLFNASKEYINQKRFSFVNRIRWGKILKGMLIWAVLLIIIQIFISIFLNKSYVINVSFNDFIIIILLFLLTVPIQVTFEELVFRGYLNQALSLKIKNPIIIILISSLCFGFMHFSLGDMGILVNAVVFTFLCGLIWSVTTLVDNGIEFGVGAHITNNFFALAFTSSTGSMAAYDFFKIFGPVSSIWIETLIQVICVLVFALIMFFYKKEAILKALKI